MTQLKQHQKVTMPSGMGGLFDCLILEIIGQKAKVFILNTDFQGECIVDLNKLKAA